MVSRRPRILLDFWLVVGPLCLVGIGVLLQYSASYPLDLETSPWASPPVRHGLYALLGIVLGLMVARVDYRLLGNFAPALYIFAVLLLCMVLVVGDSVNEVRRWISFGLVSVQPSELAKLIVTIALAKFLSDIPDDVPRLRHLMGSLGIVALPLGLVFLQPDLGSAVVFTGIWIGMAIMARVRLLHLGLTGLVVILTVPLIYRFALRSYMQQRVLDFLDPAVDPLGAGYNVLQSEISVGSGGLLGKGLLNGTQSQLDFLRVQQTDFIFSVLGEELGFAGAMLVFALFMLVLFRGLHTAFLARDNFGRLLATGIVMMLLVQVFINVGVNIQLLPVTGIPLPFLSFGGSSLLSALLSLGILQSIYAHRHRPDW